MLRRGENPPRALKLVDAAQALHPGRVDEVLLRCTAGHAPGPSLGDAKVSIDGIARKIDSRVLGRHACHVAIIPMNADLERGINLFNSGRYWDAHEAWEHAWMPDRKGPDAGFYKGLIQVAAGCLHYGRRNRRGAMNKWGSGGEYLRPDLPEHPGVRPAPLGAPVGEFLAAIKPHECPDVPMPRTVYK